MHLDLPARAPTKIPGSVFELTLFNLMKLNKKINIWFTNKHTMQKYYLLWHSAV